MATLSAVSASLSGGSDSRKASRDARVRPWLSGSVLQRQSSVSGVKGRKDAPSLSATTTVALVSSPAPTVTIGRASEKQSASKIPVLSRRCLSTPSGKGGVQEKGKAPAVPSTATGMTASASRIPVRTKASSGPRPAPLQQVRPRKDLVLQAVSTVDKEAGKKVVRSVGSSSSRPAKVVRQRFEEMSIRKCINPEPIRSHRVDNPVQSILKHRVKHPEEADPFRPLDSEKKSVTWPEVYAIPTSPRPWPKEIVPGCRCRICGEIGHRNWCYTLADDLVYKDSIEVWLKEQRSLGHDYLELSEGFLSQAGRDPTEPIMF